MTHDDTANVLAAGDRFEALTPKLHADSRFRKAITKMSGEELYPLVIFLPEDDTQGRGMPPKYVLVVPREDGSYRVTSVKPGATGTSYSTFEGDMDDRLITHCSRWLIGD